jgi:hypothetical protein
MKDITSSISGLKETFSTAVSESALAVEEVTAKVSDLGSFGSDSMKSVTDDVNQLLPAIGKAGYRVSALDVDAALPPKIAVHCALEIDIPAEQRQKLIESLAGDRISTMAVKMLFQVSDVQKALKVGALKPEEVILELGLSPAVRIRYRDPSVS